MDSGGDTIADTQFARLKELLGARGVHEGRCSFSDAWAAVSDWMATAPEKACGEGSMVGWECSRNPNDGSLAHADPPEGVPAGPLFNLALFTTYLDELPQLDLAARKQPILFRVFKTGAPEIAFRCS